MVNEILTDYQRFKQDNNDDSFFYSQPRLVHHLDDAFRSRLKLLYKEQIAKDSVVLDLMSSWTSHLPDDIQYKRVIGHGLNSTELENNVRLDSFWVQNLNFDQKLPLDDSSIDVCLMVAAWQYLQFPEQIAVELKRVIKPGGKLIISFSNRAFWSKAPNIWLNGSDFDRLNYICAVLIAQGWYKPETILEETYSKKILGILNKKGDPFFSVIGVKSVPAVKFTCCITNSFADKSCAFIVISKPPDISIIALLTLFG